MSLVAEAAQAFGSMGSFPNAETLGAFRYTTLARHQRLMNLPHNREDRLTE